MVKRRRRSITLKLNKNGFSLIPKDFIRELQRCNHNTKQSCDEVDMNKQVNMAFAGIEEIPQRRRPTRRKKLR